MKRQIITVAAIKGGTGKTTTAGALAQAAVYEGRKALAIDLDPQANLSYWIRADLARPGSYEVITGSKTAAEAIQNTPCGVDILCGSANMAGLKTSPASARRLEAAIEPVKGSYDLIVIDTAPAIGEAQNNSLFAATGVIIPLLPDAYSLQALYQVADIIEHVQQSKPDLEIIGALLTQYDGRANIRKIMQDNIAQISVDLAIPYLGEIRRGAAIEEATALQRSIYEYCPGSKPAQDYLDLYRRVIDS